MQTIAGEIQIVITFTLLLLLVTSFVVAFVFIHQQQYHRFLQEKEEMRNLFQQEILKAQLEMKEQTLHTISQEIHDNIGQVLSLVKLNLNTVRLEEDSPAAEKIVVSKDLVGKAIQDLRNLSKQLNTEHVSHQLLSASLQVELDLVQKTGLYETRLRVSGPEKAVDPQKQLIIFRIAQEALQNIIKHARARHIAVELRYGPDRLEMSIEDDGTGFDPTALLAPEASGKGTGIRNMYHRAKLIGASFALNSRLGEGTRSCLSFPIYS